MVQIISTWFPNPEIANFYGIVVLAALLSDEIIPRLVGGKGISFSHNRDRGSFILIYVSSLIGLGGGIYFRLHNIGVVTFWVQAAALVLLIVGTVIREWAIVELGRFFSRTVIIEEGHQLITDGPFEWIRHPAYTGMLIMYVSIILGIGTWAGAIFVFAVMLGATLKRIRVEEKALLDTFGDQYRVYMDHTGLLLPRWRL